MFWRRGRKQEDFSEEIRSHLALKVQPGRWPQLQSTGIYPIRPDGNGLRRLTRKDGVAGGSSWSADGQRVLFYETDELGAFLANGGQSRTEIVSIDITTGDRRLQCNAF